ncbi:serine hydrolase domain-containing protein [Photorhabdus temperata subsp. temperata]
MNDHFDKEALQLTLDSWQKVSPCLGCNVTLIDSCGNRWHGASGYKRLDGDEALAPLSKCYIYSITKVFTAVRILQLVKQGRIALAEGVTRYLPHSGLADDISVRQLLNHTSGIPSYTSLSEYDTAVRENPGQPWTPEETLRRVLQRKADFSPGTGWEYSNTNYMLLAQAIEAVTGEDYVKNITEYILHPLGLADTCVATDIYRAGLTPGYSRLLNDDEALEDITSLYHPGWCQTGLLVSTTDDISRLFIALFKEDFIGADLMKEMCGFVSIGRSAGTFYATPGYGMGLMLDPDWGTAGLFSHGGEGPGYNTWALYIPGNEGQWLILTIFCNTSMPGQPIHLVKDLLRTLAF